MGKIATALAEIVPSPSGPPCGIAVVISQLDDDDRTDLFAAFAGAPLTVKYQQISDALAVAGFDIAAETISRHCRGRCRCGRTR